MIKLNDYLYSGDTVLKILHNYTFDLRNDARETSNQIDVIHCNYLYQITELLQHNDFLTAQSQQIRDFYKFMVSKFPELAFTFKGRIKSLIRAEEKFNRYIVDYIYDYYCANKRYPTVPQLRSHLNCFRDLIAYRIVISLPQCHLPEGANKEEEEIKYLYKIANLLPRFMEERGFNAEIAGLDEAPASDMLKDSVQPFYRDYISNPRPFGYRSLHITFYDNSARCYVEIQLRTKSMDDYAEIGPANHLGYEKRQQNEQAKRDAIPVGECIFFDEAYERGRLLQQLELSKLDVNMFAATNNSLINDGCGLYRGRLILPYEHLSRFQNDLID